MPEKTHRTALALVPPESAWGPIQDIRHRHDRQVQRWPPHLNLLYPFRPLTDFQTITPGLTEVCAHLEPLTITLAEFRFFRHASGRCTLWLAPEPLKPVRHLQQTIQALFPDCIDLSRFSAGYTPHLSVGQFNTVAACRQVAAELQAAWQPLTFILAEISLLERLGEAPFTVAQQILLDGPLRPVRQ